MNSDMEYVIDKLVDISIRIKKGKQKIDFCIIADHGMGYNSTPLESEYEGIVAEITELLKVNEKYINNDILNKVKTAFDNVYRAYDSFRARTPAYGGDYTDLDSPIKADTSWLKSELRSALWKLKESDKDYYYNKLNKELVDI